MEPISDEQLWRACSTVGLRPAGLIPADLPEDMIISEEAEADGECLENDRCYDFVTSGEWVPAPGPLGLAVGHPSPGWQYLRDVVDEIQQTVPFGLSGVLVVKRDLELSIAAVAQYHAGIKPWAEAMVCVADLGIEHAHDVALSTTYGNIAELAYTLLVKAGKQVAHHVFMQALATAPLDKPTGK